MESITDLNEKQQKALMLAVLIEKYTETEITGGSLHIILDDCNTTDKDVLFCLEHSKNKKDFWGEQLCNLLLCFSEEERTNIIVYSWDITGVKDVISIIK